MLQSVGLQRVSRDSETEQQIRQEKKKGSDCSIFVFIKEGRKKTVWHYLYQFSSVAQLCPTLCNPTDCSMPVFPVHHQLPELAEIHVHRVGYAIQTSHPLSSPSPPAFNLAQHQSLFQLVSSLHQVAKVLEFQLQHQSFQ